MGKRQAKLREHDNVVHEEWNLIENVSDARCRKNQTH